MAYTFKHGDRPLDDYTIQRAVGRGGFGEVYYAISDGGREVALKYLKENPQVELRGVSHCINLKSPHLVSIFDVRKNADGEYFIIMEYISGPSLRDLLIAEPNGFSPEKAAFFTREIGKGLAYLHERGIVHRDLKPGNIFFDDGYVKIGDYGLSKFIAVSRHSVQTSSVGTVHYMAPEIGSGNYSRGVDIYALGVMLYEMICGKVPFEGSSMAEVLMKHLTSQPELDNLPQSFGKVIRKALQKDPKDRYASVEELMDELLAGEELQQSLAGFSTKSLEGAVRLGGRDRADSPMPSPNPTPGSPRGFVFRADIGRGAGPAGPLPELALPDKLARKMEKVSRKLENRMAKLGRRMEKFGFGPPPPPANAQGAPDGSPLAHVSAKKRATLIVFLLAAVAIGVGLVAGNSSVRSINSLNQSFASQKLSVHLEAAELGAASGMLVAALFGSIVLARYAIRWFNVDVGPTWAQRMVRACCAAPILAAGCAPALDAGYGFPMWLGLWGLATFADWESDGARGDGKISGGQLFGKALGAFILTAIATSLVQDRDFRRLNDNLMFISAAIGAAVSFVYQASGAWGVAYREGNARQGQWYPRTRPPGRINVPASDETLPVRDARAMGSELPPVPGEVDQGGRSTPMPPSWYPPPRASQGVPRWLVARMMWSLTAFVLMCGAIVTFIYSLVASNAPYHNMTAAVILCTSFFAFMIFAFRKTTPVKRGGLWRDTVRPFMISLSLVGIGATTTAIAREWSHCEGGSPYFQDMDRDLESDLPAVVHAKATVRKLLHNLPDRDLASAEDCPDSCRACLSDEGRAALISGLVVSSIMLLGLTFLTGRRSKPVPHRDAAAANPAKEAVGQGI